MGKFLAPVEDLERLALILAHVRDGTPLTPELQGTAERLHRALEFQVGRYVGSTK